MKRGGAVALALLMAACGGGSDDTATANRDAADVAAVEPVPAASPVPVPRTPATTLPPGEGIPGISAPAPLDRPGPVSDPAPPVAVEAGADQAVAVLRDYFAALQDGRFAHAYALWRDDGRATGMSPRAFADSYRNYAAYRATIGTPGRIDAGTGQRHIAIPVRVTGRLRDGSPVVLEGPVTLHRTGDIDGATADQRSWRIADSALRPRPATDGIR